MFLSMIRVMIQICRPYGQVSVTVQIPGMTYLTSNATGKDYSNPRILDFHTLNKPHEDMYDRGKIPRMPWYIFSQKHGYI
jgi:hypothetical protein